VTRPAAVWAALVAAALIAACGSSPEKPTPSGYVRPDLPAKTTPKPSAKPKPRKSKPTSKQTQNGPIAAPVPPFDGPIVKVTIKNDLCTPETVSAPAGKTFQLRVKSGDHTYDLVFDSTHRFTVPAHATGALRVAAGRVDQPVLSNGGEPCAVVKVGGGG